ncbi:MAG: acetyl-CoA carboxylase carboxyl transferase subunit alpha, partial [Bacteroidota bacterium]
MASKFVLDFEKPILELESKIEEMRNIGKTIDISREIDELEKKVDVLRKEIYKNLTRWQRVQIARHPERPVTLDYINTVFDDFIEL